MGEATDWDPLPPERIGLHPGEDMALGERPEDAAPTATAAVEAAEREFDARRAEAALASLQQRIDAAPRRQNVALVEAIEQRERKRERKRCAATSAKLLGCGVVASKLEAADIPLEVDYGKGGGGRDRREDESWFRDLPDTEQRRLRAVWAADRRRADNAARWNPRKMNRAMLGGAISGALIGLLLCLLGGSVAQAGAMAMLGGGGAALAQLFGGGRHLFAFVGILVFFAVYGAAALTNPYLLMGWMLTTYGFGVLGMEAEMRQSGGFDAEREITPERESR